MKKNLINNLVDYSGMSEFEIRQLKGDLLDKSFDFGTKFGRWSVLVGCLVTRTDSEAPTGTRREYASWCVCECGTLDIVKNFELRSGRSNSCGCLQKERLGDSVRTHGLSKTPEYKVWQGMIGRCHNSTHVDYCSYGEKGVTVCDKWKNSFEAFIEDMGMRPSDNHTIERVDVYGGYCPENCIWLESEKQAANKRKERREKGTHPMYEYRKAARERKARGEYRVGGRGGGKVDTNKSMTQLEPEEQ